MCFNQIGIYPEEDSEIEQLSILFATDLIRIDGEKPTKASRNYIDCLFYTQDIVERGTKLLFPFEIPIASVIPHTNDVERATNVMEWVEQKVDPPRVDPITNDNPRTWNPDLASYVPSDNHDPAKQWEVLKEIIIDSDSLAQNLNETIELDASGYQYKVDSEVVSANLPRGRPYQIRKSLSRYLPVETKQRAEWYHYYVVTIEQEIQQGEYFHIGFELTDLASFRDESVDCTGEAEFYFCEREPKATSNLQASEIDPELREVINNVDPVPLIWLLITVLFEKEADLDDSGALLSWRKLSTSVTEDPFGDEFKRGYWGDGYNASAEFDAYDTEPEWSQNTCKKKKHNDRISRAVDIIISFLAGLIVAILAELYILPIVRV